jgi:hypothetical protein
MATKCQFIHSRSYPDFSRDGLNIKAFQVLGLSRTIASLSKNPILKKEIGVKTLFKNFLPKVCLQCGSNQSFLQT